MKNKTTIKDKIILLIAAVLIIAAIVLMVRFWPDLVQESKSRYDVGYEDGYAESYNTLCKNRKVTIEADWKNKDYYKGYTAGQLAGASKCDGEKRARAFKEKN